MNPNQWQFLAAALALAGAACSLPGGAAPTPFELPTPNLTLTAIQASVQPEREVPLTPTGQPTDTETPSPTPSPAAPGEPSATVTGRLRPNGPLVQALPFAEPPSIDAELADWPTERMSLSHPVYGLEEWSDGADLSGTYAFGWDDRSLYLAVQVNDDSLVQEASGRSLFQGDGLELLLDRELEADVSSDQLSADDVQIGFSPGDFSGGGLEAYRWFPRNEEGLLTTVSLASRTTSGGYEMEVELPWDAIGVQAAAGECFGFAVSISDNDLAGSVRQQSMVSAVPTRTLTDPTTWGTLRLSAGEADSCGSVAPDL